MTAARKIKGLFRKASDLFLARRARQVARHRAKNRKGPPFTLVLLICRPHDIELYLDIWERARSHPELSPKIWVRRKALERFPATRKGLERHGMKVDFVVRHDNLKEALARLSSVDAILNTVETSYAPHKIAFRLINLANRAGVLTYTLQHAFENIGLTSTDPAFSSGKITFAAQKVFTWGPVEELTGPVHPSTKEKCVAVGCPKRHLASKGKEHQEATESAVFPGDGRPVIGVFEGVHADRFDEAYMKRFFSDLQEASRHFKEYRFILKPHPNVLARTRLHSHLLSALEGVEVIDPAKEENRLDITTPELIQAAKAVITSPSTIALDAAMSGKPVAVTRYGQPMKFYTIFEPLPLLNSFEDWQDYIQQAMSSSEALMEAGRQFLHKRILPYDAPAKIVQVIVDDCKAYLAPAGV